MLLNSQEITKEIRGNQKIYRGKKNQQKHNNPKPMGYSKSSAKREAYSNSILPRETGKTSNNLILYLEKLDKEEKIQS